MAQLCRYTYLFLVAGFLTWSALPCGAYAQQEPTGFAFLRMEPSARAAALGGSFAAVGVDDVNGLFYNPALLSAEIDRSLSVSYLNHVSDLNAGFVAYGRDLGELGVYAAGLRFLSWGGLTGADAAGQETGTFGAADVALTVGGSRAVNDRLRYGASVHAIHSYMESYAASAVAADVGVFYYLEGPQLALGATLNNLGWVLDDLGTIDDELPLDLRISAAKRLRHVPILLSVTGYHLHDLGHAVDPASVWDAAFQHVIVGGELQFSEAFQVRVGYNHRRHQMLKTRSRLDLAGLGLGVGIKVSRVKVDYAYASWSQAGGLHQFTVRTRL